MSSEGASLGLKLFDVNGKTPLSSLLEAQKPFAITRIKGKVLPLDRSSLAEHKSCGVKSKARWPFLNSRNFLLTCAALDRWGEAEAVSSNASLGWMQMSKSQKLGRPTAGLSCCKYGCFVLTVNETNLRNIQLSETVKILTNGPLKLNWWVSHSPS